MTVYVLCHDAAEFYCLKNIHKLWLYLSFWMDVKLDLSLRISTADERAREQSTEGNIWLTERGTEQDGAA
jgi:hypothetical protein